MHILNAKNAVLFDARLKILRNFIYEVCYHIVIFIYQHNYVPCISYLIIKISQKLVSLNYKTHHTKSENLATKHIYQIKFVTTSYKCNSK